MATKTATLIKSDATKLSATEKATLKADKAIIGVCKSGDIKSLETLRDRVNEVYNTLRQEGTMVGKRFSGAKTHAFDDQLAAYSDTVVRGNIAKIG